MELGGVWYRLDPAAISAIRYRAIYGESILETLNRGIPPKKLEGKLLRMGRRTRRAPKNRLTSTAFWRP